VLTLQDGQVASLADAWQGRGAASSRVFLLRHGEASARLAADLRQAGDALAVLRDELWRAVDGKVAAAQAIDDRSRVERGTWLTAAQVVVTGVGDRAAASELIDEQVKPFVDNDIRLEWVSAMRAATDAVRVSYDAAIANLSGLGALPFEIPGDVGPAWSAPATDGVPQRFSDGSTSVATSPAAAIPVAPTSAESAVPQTVPPTLSAAPAAGVESAPTAPATSLPGGLGGGVPSAGTGLSGLGHQLADVLGSLFGSLGDAELDSPAIDDPDDPLGDKAELADAESDADDDEPEDDEPEDDELGDDETDDTEPQDTESDQPVDGTTEPDAAADAVATEPVPAEPAPTAVPPPPLAAPPVAPPVATGGETPCEIALDELPQAGQ
jgi:hypothetical protein